jgi:hypothetical protein
VSLEDLAINNVGCSEGRLVQLMLGKGDEGLLTNNLAQLPGALTGGVRGMSWLISPEWKTSLHAPQFVMTR